jgi:hypothetical protein
MKQIGKTHHPLQQPAVAIGMIPGKRGFPADRQRAKNNERFS